MEEKNEILTSEDLSSLVGAEPLALATAIATRLDDKKGREVKVLEVGEKTSIADYFVLCTGNSSTHVKALAGEAEDHISKRGIEPDNVEGRGNHSWIVLDYGNVIVHVFSREAREFYNLDKLYGDTKTVLEF
ncbi:MAG: ribosome silencing factor [Clostridia bacterium]|nr:ribosome silencing factor [Clostridia bacterium]